MLVPNSLFLDHFEHPRGGGGFPAGQAGVRRGEAGSERHGALVRFELRLAGDGRISAARFKAWGCAATLACASFIAEWAVGRSSDEVQSCDVRTLAAALELPPERMYAPLLVEDAIKAAAGNGG